MTSAEVTELIAYSNLEAWGPLAEDFRAGQICAVIANVNRDPKTMPEAWSASDFMPSLAAARARSSPPILEADPETQSALLDKVLFGRA
jgi:hypothetical protein